MRYYKLPIQSKAKPAGSLGQYGNITQNKSGYAPWQQFARKHLQSQMGLEDYNQQPYGIVIEHHVRSFKCGDLMNIAGAIIDVMVNSALIKDDCPSLVNRVLCSMEKSDSDEIVIVVCDNQQEWNIWLEGVVGK